jgi:hypothetical protein
VLLDGPGGTRVRVVDPELSLVHFMVHMNRDSYRWLLGFADVARILGREDSAAEVLRWYRGQLVLSAAVATAANPGRRGPWWWRMVKGRLGREVERRRTVALLRRTEVRRSS